MAVFPSFKLTEKGEELLNRSIGEGKTLTFTKFELGDGNPPSDFRKQTGLVNKFYEFPILNTSIQKDQVLRIRGYFDNKSFSQDKQLKEIGVFVKIEGNETQYLYSYTNAGDTGDIIPSNSRGFYSRTLDVANYIGYATNITFNIEQLRDRYAFNTENEMKVASYLKAGDKVELWGNLVLGDKPTDEYIIQDSGEIELSNGLFAKKVSFKYIAQTIEEMQRLALKVGDVVEVLGYYQAGDGADHKRKIESEDDGSGVLLDNGLWANICQNTISMKMLGFRKGEDIGDKLVNVINTEREIRVDIDDEYTINKQLEFTTNNKEINFLPQAKITLKPQTTNTQVRMLYFLRCKNIRLLNPVLVGDKNTRATEFANEWNHGITILGSEDITILNPVITEMNGDGIYVGADYFSEFVISKGVKIIKPYIYDCGRNGISITSGSSIKVYDPYVEKVDKFEPKSCIDVETEHSSEINIPIDLEVINPIFKNSTGQVTFATYLTGSGAININIKNLYSSGKGVRFQSKATNANITCDKIIAENITSAGGINVGTLAKGTTVNIGEAIIRNPSITVSSDWSNVNKYTSGIYLEGKEEPPYDLKIGKLSIYNDYGKYSGRLIFFAYKKEPQDINSCVRIEELITNSQGFKDNRLNSDLNNSNIKINKMSIFSVANDNKTYYVYSAYEQQLEAIIGNVASQPNLIMQNNYPKDMVNKIINNSSYDIELKPKTEENPVQFFVGNSIPIKKNGGWSEFVYSSVDNKVHILNSYTPPTIEAQLDGTVYKNLMEQEEVYEDYANYRVAQIKYEKEQREEQKAKYEAYELLLQDNPNLTWEEFEQTYGNTSMMNLNLVEKIQEPVIPESVKKFMEKYL